LPDGIKITSLRVYPAASYPRPLHLYNPHTYLPKGATTKVLSTTPRLYNIYTYTYISRLSPPVVVPSRSVSPTDPSRGRPLFKRVRVHTPLGPKVLCFFSVCARRLLIRHVRQHTRGQTLLRADICINHNASSHCRYLGETLRRHGLFADVRKPTRPTAPWGSPKYTTVVHACGMAHIPKPTGPLAFSLLCSERVVFRGSAGEM